MRLKSKCPIMSSTTIVPNIFCSCASNASAMAIAMVARPLIATRWQASPNIAMCSLWASRSHRAIVHCPWHKPENSWHQSPLNSMPSCSTLKNKCKAMLWVLWGRAPIVQAPRVPVLRASPACTPTRCVPRSRPMVSTFKKLLKSYWA